MAVTFSESFDIATKDVVVIACLKANDYVFQKLSPVIGNENTELIASECQTLKYNEIKNYKILLNGKQFEIIVAGAGDQNLATRASVEKLGGYIYDNIKSKNADIVILNNIESQKNEKIAAYLASGLLLKSWNFDKYKTKESEKKIKSIFCETTYEAINRKESEYLDKIHTAVNHVKLMVSEPANVMDPDQVLEEALNLKRLGVKVSILEKKELQKLGMNAIVGVGMGSDKPTYLIIMEYRPNKDKDLLALVGKGLTFDSGGLCLKPAQRMGDMKGDMTGAAVVIGAIENLALQEADVNVVGVIGVVENMISGRAQKPGDIIFSMSGKTIEIDNTDAEGRLVLADALWYTCEKFNPSTIVDFATLTGAIQVALGHEFAGLFSNSQKLTKKLTDSGTIVGEKLWELPLSPSFEDDIKSDVADIKNVGSGRGAGSITAAMFLKHFVKDGIDWAHIDIAATEWDSKNRALSQKGATGFGVRLTAEFIKNYYVKK